VPSGVPKRTIIGVSIAGAIFGLLLVVLLVMNRFMKREKRRGRPTRFPRMNNMGNWRGETVQERKRVDEKGKGVVSSSEALD